jgi:hypothetical protein
MLRTRFPSVEAGLMVVLLVVSLFSFAFVFEDGSFDEITGNFVGVTGDMVKVTGMVVEKPEKTIGITRSDAERYLIRGSRTVYFREDKGFTLQRPPNGHNGYWEELKLNGDTINSNVYKNNQLTWTGTMPKSLSAEAIKRYTEDWRSIKSNSDSSVKGDSTDVVDAPRDNTDNGLPDNAGLVRGVTSNGQEVYETGGTYYNSEGSGVDKSTLVAGTPTPSRGQQYSTISTWFSQGNNYIIIQNGVTTPYDMNDPTKRNQALQKIASIQSGGGTGTSTGPDIVGKGSQPNTWNYRDEYGVIHRDVAADIVWNEKQKAQGRASKIKSLVSGSEGGVIELTLPDGSKKKFMAGVDASGNTVSLTEIDTIDSTTHVITTVSSDPLTYNVDSKNQFQQVVDDTSVGDLIVGNYEIVGGKLKLTSVKLNPEKTQTKAGRDVILLRQLDIQSEMKRLIGDIQDSQKKDDLNRQLDSAWATSDWNKIDQLNKQIADQIKVDDARGLGAKKQFENLKSEDIVYRSAAETFFREHGTEELTLTALQGLISDTTYGNDAKSRLKDIAMADGDIDPVNNPALAKLSGADKQDVIDNLNKINGYVGKAGKSNLPGWYFDDAGEIVLYDKSTKKIIVSVAGIDQNGKMTYATSTSVPTLDGNRVTEGLPENRLSQYGYHVEDGKIKDNLGNEFGESKDGFNLIPNPDGGYYLDPSLKTPPPELGLSPMKNYETADGELVWRDSSGVLYSGGSVWKANPTDKPTLTGKELKKDQQVSHTYNIKKNKDGTDDLSSTKIIEYFTIGKGGKTTNTKGTIEISHNGNKYHIDQATLAMINKYEGSGGDTGVTPRTDGQGVSIDIKDSQDRVVSNIFFINSGKKYNVEGGLLTGTRGQTDFKYIPDGDGGTAKKTTRFFSTMQIGGETSLVASANDFRTSTDGTTYYVGFVQQEYNTETGEPIGDALYSYVEANEGSQEILFGVVAEDGKNYLIATKGIFVTSDNKKVYKDGVEVTNPTEKQKYIDIKNNRKAQYSSRQWFADWEFKLTQYTGLSGFSQFLLSDETLAEWREKVDKAFSTAYLGSEYWVSAICAKHIPKDSEGTFMMQTRDGLFDVIAHVEGEVSEPVEYPDGSVHYVYKLTYSVRNPEGSGRELDFNVYLYGEERDVQLYSENKVVDEGESVSRGVGNYEDGQASFDDQNKKPIVDDSTFVYDTICIRFSSEIPDAEGEGQDETCNKIVTYSGSATGYSADGSESGSGGETVVGGDDGEEADI